MRSKEQCVAFRLLPCICYTVFSFEFENHNRVIYYTYKHDSGIKLSSIFFLAAAVSMTPRSCYEDITLARSASPYLFPCTIIYSIIAAGIIYRLYQYVGVKVKQRWPSHTSLTSSVPQGKEIYIELSFFYQAPV